MSSKTTGLGRGLDSLIPTYFSVGDVASPAEQIKNANLDSIIINPDQPRKQFDETAINELASSIRKHGIIQPLVVTPQKDKYRIVAGERRFRAAKIAGLKDVPVIVRNHEELEELEVSLVENVQRVDLSPLEQAISIVRLRDQFSLSLKEISNKLGKAETTISNIIRLTQLPKEAIVALQEKTISEGHARAILSLKTDEKLQIELLNKIITQGLSVREAESYSKLHKKKLERDTQDIDLRNFTTRLAKLEGSIGTVPKISARKNGGKLYITYKNSQELDTIIKQLEKK